MRIFRKPVTAGLVAALACAPLAYSQKAKEKRKEQETIEYQEKVKEKAEEKAKEKAETARARVFALGGGSYLGIGVAEVDSERAKALSLKEERGVEIKSVTEDSPASKAGIKEGDVVLEFGGQPVEGVEQFVRLVRETPPGRQVKLLISRGGAQQAVAATIGARPAFMSFGGRKPIVVEVPPFEMPRIEVPRLPDLPRSYMSWRSTSLGVESESLSSQLAEYFGVKEGVLVRSVIRDSAAEKAGLKAGDVIIKVDSSTVTTPREISSVLRSARSKRTFPITIIRNHKEMTVTVTLEEERGARPAAFLGRSC